MLIVDHALPKGVFILFVHEWICIHALKKILVLYREGNFPLILTQVISEPTTDRVEFLLLLNIFYHLLS